MELTLKIKESGLAFRKKTASSKIFLSVRHGKPNTIKRISAMKAGINRFISITTLFVCLTVLYGCSVTNPAVYEYNKLHVFDCKTEKIVHNSSDSTKIILFKSYYKDETVINLVENGTLNFKILKDVVYQIRYDWYEYDVFQPEVSRTSSDICKDYIEDEKSAFIQFASSKVDADGKTVYSIEYWRGFSSALDCIELKQISKGHFAIRYLGMII
ncbi:MAG: hypothetical protein ACM3MI_09955 [Clostridiales bacterium]